ncbi:hypothetical protein [Paraburkholderia sp. MM5477-R1]|uniref:hypothetical protein n=1 Tax=Paraburkholderia sp. MM5477-R1 TaxID=2991062 RepID=UPI003D1FF2AB
MSRRFRLARKAGAGRPTTLRSTVPNETLVLHHDARQWLLDGINALAEAVKVMPGFGGRSVIVERAPGVPLFANSGLVVAGSVDLSGRHEEMGAQLPARWSPA